MVNEVSATDVKPAGRSQLVQRYSGYNLMAEETLTVTKREYFIQLRRRNISFSYEEETLHSYSQRGNTSFVLADMKPHGVVVLFFLFSILVHQHRVSADLKADAQKLLQKVLNLIDKKVIPAVQQDLMELVNALRNLVTTTATSAASTDPTIEKVKSLLKSLSMVTKMVGVELPDILAGVEKILQALMKAVKDAQSATGV